MIHYIGVGGFKGQVPSLFQFHSRFESAVAHMANRFRLEIGQIESLSILGQVDLDIELHGIELLRIIECQCNGVEHLANQYRSNGVQDIVHDPAKFTLPGQS